MAGGWIVEVDAKKFFDTVDHAHSGKPGPLQAADRTIGMEHFNILDLLQVRTDQPSFHRASEHHVRVEFRNMKAGERLGPFTYGGNLVITCFHGHFAFTGGDKTVAARHLDQLVIPENVRLEIECTENGSLEIIWAPGSAPISQG